jgi:lipopolysaccharide export system protein LptA
MNPFWKTGLAALLIGFIGWFFYWAIFSPKTDLSHFINATIKEQAKQADLSFNKVSFEEIAEGEKFWQLSAATAMVNKSTGVATLQTTNGTFYKKGKAVLKFQSPSALWEMKKQEIYLDKPLGFDAAYEKQIKALAAASRADPLSVFTLPAQHRKGLGYWFQARNLSWKVADQLLFCTGGIRLNKGNVSGQAQTLKGDVEFNKVILEGKPVFTISPNNSAPVTIEARDFAIASAQDQLSANGEPVITWQDARVTAREAVYQQNKKRLHLKGDVKVIYKDIDASGAAADYLIEQQKIILTGAARATQAGSNLSGDRLIVSLKDQKISLAGRSRVVVTQEENK